MTASREDRDRLVIANLKIARAEGVSAWRRIGRAGQARHDVEDLVQAGIEGLIGAATRFDPSRGSDFGWFARTRVRGSISDYLRDQDSMSRDLRALRTRVRNAASRVEQRNLREATTDEIALELGMTPEEFGATAAKLGGWLVKSLDELTDELRNSDAGADRKINRRTLQALADTAAAPDVAIGDFWHERRTIRAMARLLPREREVLHATYVEDLRLVDVARRWRLTESRASQIRKAALAKLRLLLTDD